MRFYRPCFFMDDKIAHTTQTYFGLLGAVQAAGGQLIEPTGRGLGRCAVRHVDLDTARGHRRVRDADLVGYKRLARTTLQLGLPRVLVYGDVPPAEGAGELESSATPGSLFPARPVEETVDLSLGFR